MVLITIVTGAFVNQLTSLGGLTLYRKSWGKISKTSPGLAVWEIKRKKGHVPHQQWTLSSPSCTIINTYMLKYTKRFIYIN